MCDYLSNIIDKKLFRGEKLVGHYSHYCQLRKCQ